MSNLNNIDQNSAFKELGIWKKDSEVYQRINGYWEEEAEIFEQVNENRWIKKKVKLKHIISPVINIHTGEIYLDCNRRKILAKHAALTLICPINTIVKTIYHASIIFPLIFEIYTCVTKKQTVAEGLTNTVKSLADIFRTPLYGLIMTVIHAASIPLGLICPNSPYHTRAIIGKLERSLLWNDKELYKNRWTISLCFSPFEKIDMENLTESSIKEIQQRLNQFCSKRVKYLRNKREVCENPCRLFPKDKAFISSAYLSNHQIQELINVFLIFIWCNE